MKTILIAILVVLSVALASVLGYQRLIRSGESSPIVVNQPVVELTEQSAVNKEKEKNDNQAKNCVQETSGGGTMSGGVIPTNCCPGLTKVSDIGLVGGTCKNDNPNIDEKFFCIKCGNGVCGLLENECNCPQDCKVIKADESVHWKTYQNEQDGYELQYPANWTVGKTETGYIYFVTPKELLGVDRGGEPVYNNAEISISRDSGKNYKDINDFLSQWSYKDPNQASLWNVSAGEFLEINGINFYKYTWAHQGQGEKYLTIVGGDLFSIEFGDARAMRPLEKFGSYPQFIKMLSTFKFIK